MKCPRNDHWVWVSRVPRPVTVTAEVAVKNASMKRVVLPGAAEAGNMSSAVPSRIVAVKATATT
jgi:hypothetical protein